MVCVPVGLVVKTGWGRGPGLVRVGLHKGVGGNGGGHGGLMDVGMFDVVPCVESLLEGDVAGVQGARGNGCCW